MKKLILNTIILIAFSLFGVAQDIVVYRTGEEKEAIVKKVGVTTIEYVRYDNKEGPLYEVLKDVLFMIQYENGVKDYFEPSKQEHIKDIQVNQGMFLDNRDSTNYKYVKIGNQVWMAENLRYDDDQSPCAKTNTKDCDNCGRYYNYSNALDVCPKGWHLPSDKEWMELEIELGMNESEAARYGWRGTHPGQAPSILLKGESGLNLRMCGYGVKSNWSLKNPRYAISYVSEHAYYWTATEASNYGGTVYVRHLKRRASIEKIAKMKKSVIPIRCVKNDD